MPENSIIEQQSWHSFPAQLKYYSQIRNTIIAAAQVAGVSEKLQLRLELGFEEAVVNVISYAYQDNEDGKIWVRTSSQSDEFIIEIVDYGKKYNPLTTQPKQSADVSLENRQPGGYGVPFMKWIFKRTDYVYADFKGRFANHLTLVMKK